MVSCFARFFWHGGVFCIYPAISSRTGTDDESKKLDDYLLMLAYVDYTLNNPDTLTKYKSAAAISQKVLEAVTALCVAGEKIVTICEQGDKLLDEEIAKVYRGKKISKGRVSKYIYTSTVSDRIQAFPILPPSPHLPLSRHIPHSSPMRPKLLSL